MTVIVNGKIVLKNEVLQGYDLFIEDGKISKIEIAASSHKGYNTFDANGEYICPGFIDVHVNGGGNYMVIDGNKDGLIDMLEAHYKKGVTGILPTTISVQDEKHLKAIKTIVDVKKNYPIGRMILGIHVEGPFLSTKKRGAHNKEYLQKPSVKLFNKLYDASEGLLKIFSLAPELDGAEFVIEEAIKKNVIVGFAHSEANYKQTKIAISNGVNLSTQG